ncbi:MAG: Gfo/Idh/MocA family protein [Acidimicrobiales bacterium]
MERYPWVFDIESKFADTGAVRRVGALNKRIAVIGCGYWGANHVRVLHALDGVDVVAVDPDTNRLAELHNIHSGLATSTDLESILGGLDAAVVCTPPHTHGGIVRRTLLQGCDVLVEKPLVTSSAECRELMALASDLGRILMVGHTYDFHPAVGELRAAYARGDLGNIRYLDSARLSVGGYRDDVNVLWDMAPHDIVIMRRVLDAWPSRVSAWAIDHTDTGVPDVGMIRLEFTEPETVGYIRVSWLDPVKVRRFTVVGSDQTAIFNDVSDPLAPLRFVDTSSDPRLGEGSLHPLPPGYSDDAISSPSIAPAEPLAAEIVHFLECMETREDPLSSAAEGLGVIAVLEAADLSASTNEPVVLHPEALFERCSP